MDEHAKGTSALLIVPGIPSPEVGSWGRRIKSSGEHPNAWHSSIDTSAFLSDIEGSSRFDISRSRRFLASGRSHLANMYKYVISKCGNVLNSRLPDATESSVELCCTIYERDMGRLSRLLYPETAVDAIITVTLFFTLGIWLVVQRYKTIRDRAVLFYWPAPPVRVTLAQAQSFD